MGEFDWAKTHHGTDVANADGTHRVDLKVDICMRAENSACMRPNQYALSALMKEDDGAWRLRHFLRLV